MAQDWYNVQTDRVWVDHGSGQRILTLQGRRAGVLQTVLTLWIALVGRATWMIVKRLYYHYRYVRFRSREKHHRPIYDWQSQVQLRNSGVDIGTIVGLLNFIWSWKNSRKAVSVRTIPLVLICISLWLFWQASAILSFLAWSGTVTDRVLITGEVCGEINNNEYSYEDLVAISPYKLAESDTAETWVSQCYETSSSESACGFYPVTSLPYSKTAIQDCPFASPEVCISSNSTPYEFNSGFIDTYNHLGMNLPESYRISYRRTLTCSPIQKDLFTVTVSPEDTEFAERYPPNTSIERFMMGSSQSENFTFQHSGLTSNLVGGYDVRSNFFYPPQTFQMESEAPIQYYPAPEFFNRDDGDLALFFVIHNFLQYGAPTYDPIFSATTPFEAIGEALATQYLPDNNVTVLGCMEQHQFCRPVDTGLDYTLCTSLTSRTSLVNELRGIASQILNSESTDANNQAALSLNQTATAIRIFGGLADIQIEQTLRSEASFMATDTLSGDTQTREMPNDYWTEEVERWYAIGLAKLQKMTIDWAVGPSNPVYRPYFYLRDEDQRALLEPMCDTQMIQRPATYTNFNFTAVLIIFFVGAALLTISLTFELMFKAILSLLKKQGQAAWVLDAPLQLQRLAFQGMSEAKRWEGLEEDVPRTDQRMLSLEELESMYTDDAHAVEKGSATESGRHSTQAPLLGSPPPISPSSHTMQPTSPSPALYRRESDRDGNTVYAIQGPR